jgi:hypothetical protein
MHFINNYDLVAGAGRHEPDIFLQLADFLDPTVRSTVDLYQVNTAAAAYLPAGTALIAWFGLRRPLFAVECLGHDSGQGGLADAPHPAENHGMGDTVLGQSVLQGPDDSLLADNLTETRGTGFSGKDKI